MNQTLETFNFVFADRLSIVVVGALFSACLWIPLVFAAYAIGRRKVDMWFIFALLTAEAASLGVLTYLLPSPF